MSATDSQSPCGSANAMPIMNDSASTELLRMRADTSSLNSRFPMRRGSRSDFTDRRTAYRFANAKLATIANALARSSARLHARSHHRREAP